MASRYRTLVSSYGVQGRFCLVLKIVEPLAFGPDYVEIATDENDAAFTAAAVRGA